MPYLVVGAGQPARDAGRRAVVLMAMFPGSLRQWSLCSSRLRFERVVPRYRPAARRRPSCCPSGCVQMMVTAAISRSGKQRSEGSHCRLSLSVRDDADMRGLVAPVAIGDLLSAGNAGEAMPVSGGRRYVRAINLHPLPVHRLMGLRAFAAAAATRVFCSSFHAANCSGATTLTTTGMKPCPTPHSSAHWPR